MNRIFRIIKMVFLILGILLCLAIPVAGIISTATGWEGICYGFTDGQHNCSWWEYAGTEIFWASFLFIPLLFGAAVIWLAMSAVQFILAIVKKRKQTQVSQTDTTS